MTCLTPDQVHAHNLTLGWVCGVLCVLCALALIARLDAWLDETDPERKDTDNG